MDYYSNKNKILIKYYKTFLLNKFDLNISINININIYGL